MKRLRAVSTLHEAVLILALIAGCSRAPANSGVAAQSSSYSEATGASNAADGNTDGNLLKNSVAITGLDRNAWWQLDVGASVDISSIVVWNRTDCCLERLDDYWVFVSDTPFGPTDVPSTLQSRPGTFGNHQTMFPNPSTSIPVNAKGRYVRVQLSGENYLSIAEVVINKKS
jgi:hypothetical protein